jgi:ABC-type glutathione transport system ATPase component
LRPGAVLSVIDDVSLEVWPGEIVGVIGESGSGKTMTALSLLGLMPRRARIAAGEIALGGETITHLPDSARRRLRGSRVAFIPQDALRALNPVLRVDLQVGEPANIHRRTPWEQAKAQAVGIAAGRLSRIPSSARAVPAPVLAACSSAP